MATYENARPGMGTTRAQEDARGIVELLKDLRDEAVVLFRQEVTLAKTEMSEKAAVATRNIASIAIGAAVAMLGLIILLLSFTAGVYLLLNFVVGLSWQHSLWLAPLLVGGLFAIIGAVLIVKGKNKLATMSPVPEKTVETLKEDKEWIAKHAH